MTAGAVAGVCIVRYSPLPLIADIAVSFAFTAVCLMLFRASLPPLISAGMLPILLGTDSWIYPAAVLTMTLTVAAGQRLMERGRLRRQPILRRLQRSGKKRRSVGCSCSARF